MINDKIFNLKITSKSNGLVTSAAKLADKKGRESSRLFLCEGIKLFTEAVDANAEVNTVFIKQSECENVINTSEKYIKKAKEQGAQIILLGDDAFSKISTEIAPQGIIACVKKKKKHQFKESDYSLYNNEKIILFESLRDPGNVGSVLRCAAAFGFDRVIFSADSADIYNPKTVRSSMGALFRMNIDIYKNLLDAVNLLKSSGRRLIAAVVNSSAVPITDIHLKSSDCFVIGNEGHGLSESLINACSENTFIPISNAAESLNASIAAAVIMWEMSRINLF